jgi:hypothetical protein
MKLKFAATAAILSALLTISNQVAANAIEWPLSLADAKAFGESTTTNAMARDASYKLTTNDSKQGLNLVTPFYIAAFTFANNKQSYSEATSSELLEMKHNSVLLVTAYAFSDSLTLNDGMVVVIKQDGHIIHPISSHKDSVSVAPTADYMTNKSFEFSLSSFRYNQPFTLILANMAPGNTDSSWNVDPNTIR